MKQTFEAFTVGACILGTGVIYGNAIVSAVRGEALEPTVSPVLRQENQTVQQQAGLSDRHPQRTREASPSDVRDRLRVREPDGGIDSGRQDGDASLPALVKAIAYVESRNVASAIGDEGEAIGLLQIHRIALDDVNRVLGWDKYAYADRYDAGLSKEMFMIYSKHYAEHHNDWSAEGVSRRWNGGGRGHLKKATIPYWNKVRKAMREH